MNLIEYPDRDMLAIDVANTLAGELENSLLRHDNASFAVPGGSTPGPIFDVLCAADIDWDRVRVMLTDERWVPEDHERSNAGLVRSRLLTNRAARAEFVPFWRAGLTPEQGAKAVSEALAPEMPISLILLGMGADMHTASLFPGAEGLDAALESGAPVLCPIYPADQEPRVSLSASAINGAMSKHLVIYGADKRAALEAATALEDRKAPVGAVLDGMTVHWAD